MPTTNADKLGALSSILLIIGGFLPWDAFYTITFFGYQSLAGKGTIICGVLSLLVILFNMRQKNREIIPIAVTLVVSIISIFIMLIFYSDFRGFYNWKPLSGVWITAGGAILLFLSSIWNLTFVSKPKEQKNQVLIPTEKDPVNALKLRLANGEITKDEYEELLQLLKEN
jgi:uncharacterized membrane protein